MSYRYQVVTSDGSPVATPWLLLKDARIFSRLYPGSWVDVVK